MTAANFLNMDHSKTPYCPLQQSSKGIRVLTLRGRPQSTAQDYISCSLETVELEHANPFYALSYVWGLPIHTAFVDLDGSRIPIPRNLHRFLIALRDRFCTQDGDKIRLWADSLCINQQDVEERGSQVSFMGDIYQSADAVYAWLGDSETGYDDGMTYIQEVSIMRAQNRLWSEIARAQGSRMQNIASSSYWTRLWIKQEVLLARDVWFFSANEVANWKDVKFAANLPHERLRHRRPHRTATHSELLQVSATATAQEPAIVALLNLRSSPDENIGLPDLINRFRTAECHDPRDRIYALLSLVDPQTKSRIKVEYDKPLLQVLLENFPHWTGESVSDRGTAGGRNGIPWYSLQSLCSHMARVLPMQELDDLKRSEVARQDITARGLFLAPTLLEIVSISAVATIRSGTVQPLRHESTTSLDLQGFVLRIIVRGNQRERFVYANLIPIDAELVTFLGPRIFIFRRRRAIRQESADEVLELLTTGSVIIPAPSASSASDRLSTLVLQHPCNWAKQQLTDARFTLHECSPKLSWKSRTPEVAILCNGPALITLLIESQLLEPDHHPMAEPKTQTFVPDPAREKPGKFELWSPYVFGVQHGLLDPCRTCETSGRSSFARPLRQEGHDVTSHCRCEWRSLVQHKPVAKLKKSIFRANSLRVSTMMS